MKELPLSDADLRRCNPMNDVAFKFIFGKDERKQITIDFLNAVLQESLGHEIRDVAFRQTEMPPDGAEGAETHVEDATSTGVPSTRTGRA